MGHFFQILQICWV